MNKQIFLTTNRLILRQWSVNDIPLYAGMNADPEVMKFFPRLQTEEESAQFVDTQSAKIADVGYGLFAVELKHSTDFIGFIGLSIATFDADFTPCTEVGWRLRKEFWNQGYATEGAIACLEFGFKNLQLEHIYSFTATLNLPSERVMQKIGMSKIGEFLHPRVPDGNRLKPHVLYRSTSGSSTAQIM